MPTQLMLSSGFKKIGWILLIPACLIGIFLTLTDYQFPWLQLNVFALVNEEILGKTQFFRLIETNATNTLVGVVFIAGALLVCFSEEKNEDEYIADLRLKSLQWSLLLNYLLLLFAFMFVYGLTFLSLMIYNMFTMITIFIVRFNYILYRNKTSAIDEK